MQIQLFNNYVWESISEVRQRIFRQNQKSIEQIPKSGYLDITDSTGSGHGSCSLWTAGHVWRLENCFSSENGAPWSSIASWSAVDHRWKSTNVRINLQYRYISDSAGSRHRTSSFVSTARKPPSKPRNPLRRYHTWFEQIQFVTRLNHECKLSNYQEGL